MSTKEIVVNATADQINAWGSAAGERGVDAWLADVADEAAARASAKRHWPVVITLKNRVEIGSQIVTSLEFREGCLGDLKGIKVDGGGITLDQLMLIASRMCGQPIKVIEKLKGRDGAEAMGIARDFFAESLTGGMTP